MSEPADLTLKPHSAGVLAPSSFKVGDKQYVAAAHSATGVLVGNGAIPNASGTPAAPGETIVFYGIGFGPVTPNSFPIAGQVARASTNVTLPVEFYIADQRASILYAGHVPGLVGLYQFNVSVPSSVSAGDAPVRITIAGEAVPQTLFLPVRPN